MPLWRRQGGHHQIVPYATDTRCCSKPERAIGGLGDRLNIIVPQTVALRIDPQMLWLQPEQPSRSADPQIAFAILEEMRHVHLVRQVACCDWLHAVFDY